LYDEAATHHPVISLLSRDYSYGVYNTHYGEKCQDWNPILKFKANAKLRGREQALPNVKKPPTFNKIMIAQNDTAIPGPLPGKGTGYPAPSPQSRT
jgi:hypothetical protein